MLRRLAVNSASNLIKLFVSIAVTFVMAPFYLEMMGHHDYGLREMILSLIGYMGLIDLGMRPTMSRFCSMHNAQDDGHTLNIVYACSLVFMIIVGFLIAIFFWCWAAFYPEILANDENSNVYKYALFLFVVGIQVLFAFPRFVSESFLEGLQLYYLKTIVEIVELVALTLLSLSFMTPTNALVILSVFTVILSSIKLVVFSILLMSSKYGSLYPILNRFRWPKLKEMMTFGFKSFVEGAASTIERMSDRIIIGTILGPASIPTYSIPLTLVNYVDSITLTSTHAFMPFFSDLEAKGRRAEITSVYLTASKLIVGLVVAMSVGVSIVGAPFIEVWMSGQFDMKTVNLIIVLLVLYILTPNLNPFATRFLTAINKHGIFARIAPLAAAANLGLSIWAVIEFGVIGAALGSVLPVFVVTPIYMYHSCLHLHISMLEYLNRCVLPAIIPSLIMGSTILSLRLEWGLINYWTIGVTVAIGIILYVVAFWVLSLSKAERDWVISKTILRH